MAYATASDVNALLGPNHQIGASTTPTTTQVTAWISQAEARIEALLSKAGYSVPATGAGDILILRDLVVKGVACQLWGVRSPTDSDQLTAQTRLYCQEWQDALKAIANGSFALLNQARPARSGVIYASTMQDDD